MTGAIEAEDGDDGSTDISDYDFMPHLRTLREGYGATRTAIAPKPMDLRSTKSPFEAGESLELLLGRADVGVEEDTVASTSLSSHYQAPSSSKCSSSVLCHLLSLRCSRKVYCMTLSL
jgi:hypothetical protein